MIEKKPSETVTTRQRWRLRAIVGASLIFLYALTGFFLVPWIAEKQIVKQCRTLLDREARLERIRFNPFTLAATVEGFRLADRDGETLVAFDRLSVNFETSGVFRRAFRFAEIALDRPFVHVRILGDGRFSIADLLERGSADAEEDGPSSPPRLVIDRFAVHEGSVDFSDLSRSPAYATTLTPLNVEVHDLMTLPDNEGVHALRIGFGEGTELRWNGRQSLDPFRLTGRVETDGVDLTVPWEYLGASFPLDLRRGRADAAVTYDVSRGPDGNLQLRLTDASASVRDIAAGPRGEEPDWLTIEGIRVEDVDLAWPAATVGIGSVRVDRPQVVARLQEDGGIDWLRLFEKRESDPSAAPTATPWTVRVAGVEINGGAARFEDQSVEPNVAVDVTDLAITLADVSSDLSNPFTLRTTARVNENGSVSVGGSVIVEPLAADLDVRLDGLDLVGFQPYLAAAPGIRLASAVAGTDGKVTVSGEPIAFGFEGATSLDRVEILDPDGRRLLAWKGLRASGIRASGLPAKLRVKKVDVEAPYANLFIDRGGKVNLADMGSTAPASKSSGAAPDVEIVAIDVRNAAVDFQDESLILPFATKIHSGTARVRDLSTVGAAPASLQFEGRIDETGFAKAGGGLRLSDPYASTDIEVQFRDVALKGLTPYSAEFAGYALERGSLDVDINYRIEAGHLVGTHQVVAKDLVLGDRIEGSSAATLPVRLAVALLKDKDGNIDLEVPIEGTVDSPEFAYRKVIWQAVKKILVNIASAPFRAIGRLFGAGDDELELVEFDPGRSVLLPVERDKLSKLAIEIAQKPELTVAVEGRYDPERDADALRESKMDALLDSRRAEAAEAEGATLDLLLEQIYTERFSAQALEAERARFVPTSEPVEGESRRDREKREEAAAASFDAPAFYESLRNQILDSQVVTEEDLRALALERARSVVEGLTAGATLDVSRVAVSDPVAAERKKKGSERIASEMTLAAEKESD